MSAPGPAVTGRFPVPARDDAGPTSAWHRADTVLGAAVHYDAHAPVLLSGPAADDLTGHHDRFGPRPAATGTAGVRLLDTLDGIGLAGRGGGHFAASRKWRTVLESGRGGIVVANGAEGEPASAKDAALLQHRPHLVLDGLACAAEAVGASRSVVWLHAGAHTTRRAVLRALEQRRADGLREHAVEVVTGPDGYLSGESSAIVRALSGGPALPAFAREPAARRGVGGLPTLVHNVETLARVAAAARNGATGYRDTTLVTVVADGRRSVLEVDPGSTVAAALRAARGPAFLPHQATPHQATPHQPRPHQARPDAEPQAVLLGGYGGSWLPWSVAADLTLDHRTLREAGAGLGAGVVAVLPQGTCGLAQTAALADYLARSGARQCGPCLFGLNDVAELVTDLSQRRAGRAQLRRLVRFCAEIEGRGACHHPDGVVRMVRSALATFDKEVDRHLGGRCGHDQVAPAFPLPRTGAR